MSVTLNKRNVGSVTILEMGPRLTIVEGAELRDAVNELLGSGRDNVLLDCTQVNFVDSQGIGALVRTWVSAGRGDRLKLFSLTPRFKEVLELTGLSRVMDCFDDVGGALQSSSVRQASA
ncbi:MAG TPA: STAS domain-containing protein [Candidatus Acidoferrales bacterium]|nr:STAS domain-containing protein [Candidatus Acidoferrales bacterium]